MNVRSWNLSNLSFLLALALVIPGCSDDSSAVNDGSTTGDATVQDSGGSSKTVKLCRATCKTDTDCPQGTMLKGSCGADGYCKLDICSAKSGCLAPGLGECINLGGGNMCMPKNCSKSTDCTAPNKCTSLFPNYKGCTTLNAECTTDTQCSTMTFHGYIPGQLHCDTASKYCSCKTDKECQDGKKALKGTWKCVDFTLVPWKAL